MKKGRIAAFFAYGQALVKRLNHQSQYTST
jgi:hypothetical protein